MNAIPQRARGYIQVAVTEKHFHAAFDAVCAIHHVCSKQKRHASFSPQTPQKKGLSERIPMFHYRYPISFLLEASGSDRLMNLHGDNAEDDLSISLAQQAVAAQQSHTAACEYSYTDGLTLRRIPVPIATPLPHALEYMTATNVTRFYIYIANAHAVAKWLLQRHRPLLSLQLTSRADVSAAARLHVCSSATAASLAILLSSNEPCGQCNSDCATAIVSRIYAVYCSRVQVRRAVPQSQSPNTL
jgi:hypothetical protein